MAKVVAPYAWRRATGYDSSDLPSAPGCYAIYFDRRLVYIGQSVNLRYRFSTHHIRHGYGPGFITPWGGFENVKRLTVKWKPSRRYGDWAMRELRLLRRLQPELNLSGAGKRRSPNGRKRNNWQKAAYEALRNEAING